MAVFRVERTRDYTVMSNHHLKNKELSLKAKGLMSLILSLPEDWDYTTKGLSMIVKDGVDSICSTVKELERTGYVTRQRIRDSAGRLGDIEYTIHEQPKCGGQTHNVGSPGQASISDEVDGAKSITPVLSKAEILDNTAVLPKSEKPVLDNAVLENANPEQPKRESPILEKPKQVSPEQDEPKQVQPEQEKPVDNKYNNILNTQELNTKGTNIHQSILRGDGVSEASEVFRDIIKSNIEYEILSGRYGRERMDEITELMFDIVCGERSYFTIGGSRFSAETVKLRMLKIKACHIEYVFDCLDKNTSKIQNIRNYLIAALYNSPTTLDSYYGTEVRHDLNGGLENGQND